MGRSTSSAPVFSFYTKPPGMTRQMFVRASNDLRISGFEMGEIGVAFEASGNEEEDDLPGHVLIATARRVLCV